MKLEDLVTKTKTANKEIVALSSQITSSVKQLSMLSINARIEAARSGEAGLGFAVVADEMKTLAEENGRLAGHITEKINASEVT
ncbi:MAG: methyl-accepting chemotaxis protein [Boseongicola sp.]|nr:methyl-accepting chemotaxis protein [Boseongicola sp.]MDD9977464.1 methyl-accepting chemotaxis protein [Boseongicola sp.]